MDSGSLYIYILRAEGPPISEQAEIQGHVGGGKYRGCLYPLYRERNELRQPRGRDRIVAPLRRFAGGAS